MSHRADEIRKRIAKRKRERVGDQTTNDGIKRTALFLSDEERYGSGSYPTYEGGPGNNNGSHPLFRADVLIFKLLLSACLVLVTAIIFKDDSPVLKEAKTVVTSSLEEEFQFAAVSKWYSEQFGEPLALFQPNQDSKTEQSAETNEFSTPASGRVLETFQDNGQGIMVETESPSVEAIEEGMVEKVEKTDAGLTIVLQHADGTKSWYGNLNEIDVTLYAFVEKGTELGKIKTTENEKGTYYFAIKKGDNFIDPIQVMSFD